MFKTKTKSRLKRMLSGALALAMTASAAAVMPASAEETAKWFCQYVGLSIILDTIIKKFARRKPFEGTHRTVVCST